MSTDKTAVRLAAIVAMAISVVMASMVTGNATPLSVPGITEVPTVPGPVQTDHGAAATYAKHHPHSVPLGVNNFRCRPVAGHRRPVVLVHGTDSNAYSDWAAIAPQLVRAGYCVFALNYGAVRGSANFGVDDMDISARQLAVFVDRVLLGTGVGKVDLVGYSQGTTVGRWYLKRFGGAAKVQRWIGLASPSYGGTFYGIVPFAEAVPGAADIAKRFVPEALIQQAQGSPFLATLNRGGDTVPGVSFTTIGSRVDEVIQPFTNIALRDRGAVNLLVQDLCSVDMTGHFNLPYDRLVQQLILNVLDPATARRPGCVPVALGTGIGSVIMSAHS